MNIKRINAILTEFMSQSEAIQGLVLTSSDGQLLTEPLGMDNNSAMIMSGIFLHLAQTTYQEFEGQEIEHITVQGQDGHLIFTCFYPEVFLLIKASQALSFGFLQREINLTRKKLQAELQETKIVAFNSQYYSDLTSPELNNSDSSNYLPKVEKNDKKITNSQIRYRGLPNQK